MNITYQPRADAHPVRRRRLELSSGTVSILEGGDEDRPVALFVHGGGFDSAELSWRGVLERGSAGWRRVAVDLPGFGESPAPSGEVSTETFVDVVVELVEHFGSAALVGESLGSAAVLLAALEIPERVAAVVAAGAHGLSSRPTGGLLAFVAARIPGAHRALWEGLAAQPELLRRALDSFFWGRSPVNDEVVAEIGEALDPERAADVFRRWQKTEIELRGYRTDLRDRLAEFSMPVLLVQGTDDPIVDVDDVREAATRLGRGRLVTIEGCGHWVPREAPERFDELLWGFLDEHGPR